MQHSEIDSLNDKVFCLQYELDLLAGQVTGGGLERWIEGFTPFVVHQEHLQRYKYACQLAKGHKVLDLACGTGRGSRMLAEDGGAAQVLAYDIEEKAVRYAQIKNHHPNVVFQARDGLQLGHQSEFDLAVCFETIEHVQDPELFVARLAKALKAGGVLLISTPLSLQEVDLHPVNPYHLREWGLAAFRQLLGSDFTIRKIHLQYRPLWRPPLWSRIIAKIRGSSVKSPYSPKAIPTWVEFSKDALIPPLPPFSAAYQVFECVRK